MKSRHDKMTRLLEIANSSEEAKECVVFGLRVYQVAKLLKKGVKTFTKNYVSTNPLHTEAIKLIADLNDEGIEPMEINGLKYTPLT